MSSRMLVNLAFALGLLAVPAWRFVASGAQAAIEKVCAMPPPPVVEVPVCRPTVVYQVQYVETYDAGPQLRFYAGPTPLSYGPVNGWAGDAGVRDAGPGGYIQ